MSSSVAEIEALVDIYNDTHKTLSNIIKDKFEPILLQFFKDNPVVTALGWLQYTPYFNDGDACVFSMNGICMTTDIDYNEDDEWLWSYGYSDSDLDQSTRDNYDKLETLMTSIPDEIFKDVFGEHSKVIATPSGITVEEYDHD